MAEPPPCPDCETTGSTEWVGSPTGQGARVVYCTGCSHWFLVDVNGAIVRRMNR